MSMHQYMPNQAVLADSWTLFCPECAQKMRIIMAAPAQDGKETRTFECVSGHREWMTVALHRRDVAPAAASQASSNGIAHSQMRLVNSLEIRT